MSATAPAGNAAAHASVSARRREDPAGELMDMVLAEAGPR